VTQISGNVFSQLLTAESERAKRLPPDAMGIWEHCQLARSYFKRWEVSIETISRTLDNLERAIATAPEYALGHAILSWGCNTAIVNGAYEMVGASETFAAMHDCAIPRLERVLERNPANVEAWYFLAQAYA